MNSTVRISYIKDGKILNTNDFFLKNDSLNGICVPFRRRQKKELLFLTTLKGKLFTNEKDKFEKKALLEILESKKFDLVYNLNSYETKFKLDSDDNFKFVSNGYDTTLLSKKGRYFIIFDFEDKTSINLRLKMGYNQIEKTVFEIPYYSNLDIKKNISESAFIANEKIFFLSSYDKIVKKIEPQEVFDFKKEGVLFLFETEGNYLTFINKNFEYKCINIGVNGTVENNYTKDISKIVDFKKEKPIYFSSRYNILLLKDRILGFGNYIELQFGEKLRDNNGIIEIDLKNILMVMMKDEKILDIKMNKEFTLIKTNKKRLFKVNNISKQNFEVISDKYELGELFLSDTLFIYEMVY